MPLTGLLQILPHVPRPQVFGRHRVVEPAGDPVARGMAQLAAEKERRKQDTIAAFLAAEGTAP